MSLEDSLRQLDTRVADGDYSISIKFNRLERAFDDKNRLLVLYSDIVYKAENFEWISTIPIANIPYRDPSLGFLIEGVIFSSVGIYSRAPGIVPDVDKRVLKENIVEEPKVEIVTARNSTISLGYKRNAVHIIFKRGGSEHKVPIGIFLKALSGLPYAEILKDFAYKPQMLLNGFPCSIPKGGEDLSKAATYGVDSVEEPSIDDCVNTVYSAITQIRGDARALKYSTQWKVNRIMSLLNGLHFKTRQKYEATLSVGHRAVGTYLDQDIDVPYFKRTVTQKQKLDRTGKPIIVKDVVETVEHFKLPKGHYIVDSDAREIRRFDISTLRVRTSRSFVLQEKAPMYFRAKGYKLLDDFPEVGGHAGDIIDDDLLSKINDTSAVYLNVYTPNGRKMLHRSSENTELGDFYTILNYLFTHTLVSRSDVSQYEISNRVIFDYDRQVNMEVEQTYSDIVSAIMGTSEMEHLLSSFPKLPSNKLISYLRNARHKEIAQSDITNIMSRAISDTKASALMPETPAEMMPVQRGQYGRLDSFHAPDSDKVGSVQQRTILAKINDETGEIEAPYERVVDSKPTGEIVYLTAVKEKKKYIAAWDETFEEPVVMARYNGDVTTVDRSKVEYRDPSPFCDMSVSRMCIPFPEFSQAKRAMMATKMNGQAIPVLYPERPIVSTGADTEVPCLYYTGRDIVKHNNVAIVESEVLELVGHEWKKNMVDYRFIYNGKALTFSVPFTATDKESLYHYNLNLNDDKHYGLDDIVFYHQCCDIREYEYWDRVNQGAMPLVKDYKKPSMALGVNLRVCFKTYGSSTVDDALLISDRLITDNVISSIQIVKYTYKLRRNEELPEVGWCAPLHSHVYKGQPVITVSRLKSNKGWSNRDIYCKQEGEVVYISRDAAARELEVWVSTIHTADIGDKMAGRYGDKSVIAKIVPEWMMPYDPDTGETIDVVLSPLGMPSRMNYGRILEVALGGAMMKEGKHAVVTPFYPGIKREIETEYANSGMEPKRLFNPVYGKLTERPVMTGVLYLMKLEQISNLKLRAVGYPTAVDPVFGQTVDSVNHNKGQAIGEMESWALAAAGAHGILNSLYSFYADDEEARRAFFDAMESNIEGDTDWDESSLEGSPHSVNKNALVTQTVMRMFGLDIEVKDNKYCVVPLNLNDIPVQVTQEEFIYGKEAVSDSEWFTVPLSAPVINPFWILNFPLHIVLGIKSVKTLVAETAYLDLNQISNRSTCIVPASEEHARMRMITGIDAVIELVKNTTIDEAIQRLVGSKLESDIVGDEEVLTVDFAGSSENIDDSLLDGLADVPMNVADVVRFLNQLKASGRDLQSLIWYSMPIMPRIFRQNNVVDDREREHSFQTQLKAICSSRSTSQGIFESLKDLIGYGKLKQENLVSIRGYFFGKGSQAGNHGRVRGSVLSKRIGFSGRVVITPMEDPSISPFFVGLPWHAVMIELSKTLSMRLGKRSANIAHTISKNTTLDPSAVKALTSREWQEVVESLGDFNAYILSKHFVGVTEDELYFIYHYIRSIVRELVEGDVTSDGLVKYKGRYVDPATLPDGVTVDCAMTMVGRQPTLHKKSIRSYFVKLVDGYCMRIHPIVCAAYNADFDGDQMWHAQLFGNDKLEASRTISVMQDLISEKDGSFTLELAQDVALGIYCATTFRDNAATFEGSLGAFHYFDNIKELRTQIEYGDLHLYEAVVFNNNGDYYMSTAGRVLVNGVLPCGFTQLPFTDSHSICERVLGAEFKSKFKELRYDTVWTTTSIRPAGRDSAVKIADIMLDIYTDYGPRPSIMAAQAVYELGLMASDIYSITMTLDDMSSKVDKTRYMSEPKEAVARLNSLYQLGLITDESRQMASVHAWDKAKKDAQIEIINSLDPASNTFYMMYSGARGKPDQIMQSVGFIGNISKTKMEDIEYPILRGYGEGLSSLDLAQTAYSARIGVISAQAGTKETGYAGRQSVYMTSGLAIKGHDCGIDMRLSVVEYDRDRLRVRDSNGVTGELVSLLGEFVDPNTDNFDVLRNSLTLSGYIVNEQVLSAIIEHGVSKIKLLDREIEILYSISPAWRSKAVKELYSYSLPFTEEMKITDKTVDWIESFGLREVIAFGEDECASRLCFDREAYLPVDYDTSKYSITLDGREISNEALYTLIVDFSTKGYHYFKNLLTADGNLTEKAINYLTKKKIRELRFMSGEVVSIDYELSGLFKNIVEGRVSAGLPYLDGFSCITKDTIRIIEEYQLEYIPVRTSLTCLAPAGICASCYGKSLSTNKFMADGTNLGIAASQAMTEPLSQASLNVGHSGGKRGSGTGLVSGLDYYKRMLKGSMVTERTAAMLEGFSKWSGYVQQNKHSKAFIQIIEDDGVIHNVELDDESRLNVPNGAYIDANDTLVVGLPDFERYNSTDVFDSALKTRYMLLKEYNRIFSALQVSARNSEIMARAQTSLCYACNKGATAKTRDTAIESANPTGNYMLKVSNQAQVVCAFSGIAGYGFENVANMLLMELFTPNGLPLNSVLGNLITGTEVGSTEAKFIKKYGDGSVTLHHKSNIRKHAERLSDAEHRSSFSITLGAIDNPQAVYSLAAENAVLDMLRSGDSTMEALPEFIESIPEEDVIIDIPVITTEVEEEVLDLTVAVEFVEAIEEEQKKDNNPDSSNDLEQMNFVRR